jgi:Family of unknown function (DUF5670)
MRRRPRPMSRRLFRSAILRLASPAHLTRSLKADIDAVQGGGQECIGSSPRNVAVFNTWHVTCVRKPSAGRFAESTRRRMARAVLNDGKRFGGLNMLWTIFLVLVVLWMLGVVSSFTLGGFIHLLLVLAVIALLVQLIQGRRVV